MIAYEEPCRICGTARWSMLYQGPARVGPFGGRVEERTVVRCDGCAAGFMVGEPAVDYTSEDYRIVVDGTASVEGGFKRHDFDQTEKIAVLGTGDLRGLTIADVGSGVGSFLDLVKGMAARTIAVEPAEHFHEALRERGHEVYSNIRDAAADLSGGVDLVVCFSVIEHLETPKEEIEGMRRLLKPGGRLLLSTPNLNDWLLEAGGEAYASFFYRVVHRWYFDGDSVRNLLRASGFARTSIQYVHRFDLSNALMWMRDRRPTGRAQLPVGSQVDAAYRAWLESEGRADYLYAWAHA